LILFNLTMIIILTINLHVAREWCIFVTVDMVFTLKYLYEPIEAVLSIGPQFVNEGSAS
jgi:hypothetical protein